jgi:hypothetical protein
MSLATLFSVPATPGDISAFALANAADHIDTSASILAKFNIQVSQYVFDPLPTEDVTGWLLNHQASHNQINGILGVGGNDLSVLDFQKPDEVASWIFLHADEHRKWQIALTG